ARAGGHGHRDRLDLQRPDDRARGAPRGHRRRARGGGVVMSRIGKQPIALPSGVELAVEPELVRVKGPKGELRERISRDMKVEQADGQVVISRPSNRRDHRALHGLTRSLVANMVQGVTDGFEKRLQIQGVGYRAALRGTALELLVGYSHPVTVEAPEGIEFEVPQPTQIIVRGASK